MWPELKQSSNREFSFRSAWQTAIFKSRELNVFFLIKQRIRIVSSCEHTHFMRNSISHKILYNLIITFCTQVLSLSSRLPVRNSWQPYSSCIVFPFEIFLALSKLITIVTTCIDCLVLRAFMNIDVSLRSIILVIYVYICVFVCVCVCLCVSVLIIYM